MRIGKLEFEVRFLKLDISFQDQVSYFLSHISVTYRIKNLFKLTNIISSTLINRATPAETAITTMVSLIVSARVGQMTLASSLLACLIKVTGFISQL